jgi:peptidoglycan hydrolase-like protein with peptidoglycan-binding domain
MALRLKIRHSLCAIVVVGAAAAAPSHASAGVAVGWQEQAMLVPNNALGVEDRDFGADFAVSSDGMTALVSESADVAWVFSRTGATWTRQAKLQLEGASGGGAHVALSADGNTAVLAGPSAPGPVAAWVFTRTGETWNARGEPLIASGAGPRPPGQLEELESFASAVAISSEGNAIVVGANWDSGDTGAAWVFLRSSSGWAQQGPKLTPHSPSSEERFGDSVALSASGERALIGGVGDRQRAAGGDPPEGAGYVFERSGVAWSQTAKLVYTPEGRFDSLVGLGSVVALSADGNTALLGGHGRAVIFVKTVAGWQQRKPALTPRSFSNYAVYRGPPAFGDVAALSADGMTALVSGLPEDGCGRYDNEVCSSVSAVTAFSRRGEAWVRHPLPLVGSRSLGAQVALSGNGEAALIRSATVGPRSTGAVLVSRLTPLPQSGFVVEPATVEYDGAVELPVWGAAPARYIATARVLSPRAGARSVGRCKRLSSGAIAGHCQRRGVLPYGKATATGVENVALAIAPNRAMRRYLARHKRLRIAVTIRYQPRAPQVASSQTITLTVAYRRAPSGF